jgi:hypothetical protein
MLKVNLVVSYGGPLFWTKIFVADADILPVGDRVTATAPLVIDWYIDGFVRPPIFT